MNSNYIILHLERDKNEKIIASLVGSPEKRYLWILSRDPVMGIDLYYKLVNKAKTEGYNVKDLIKTIQTHHNKNIPVNLN
jgi:apolipoprotein D and lipocalin family protein